MIYLNDKMIRLPTDMSILYKAAPPFDKPLYRNLLKEIFIPRKKAADVSLHVFVSRRFGNIVADTLVDPLIRGITAGDARDISVKFMLARPFELEQKYGSVILGSLITMLMRKKPPPPDIPGLENMGSSNLARTARDERWSVWSLESGIETLPKHLEHKLVEAGVEIRKNSPVQSISFDKTGSASQVHFQDGSTSKSSHLECSQIISTIPAWDLAKILGSSNIPNSQVVQLLSSVPSVDVTVTNLKFTGVPFPTDKEGFGFLVPSHEKSLQGLLGIVFNTCAFPQGDDVILTAMSRGIKLETILKYVEMTLGFRNPCFVDSVKLRKCIPQYTVGHYERVEDVRKIISDLKLPLTVAGASFDGVSVNDCVLSGKKAGEKLPFDVIRGT
jgi:oxygen-dependent protoporphyrinogen oxidase